MKIKITYLLLIASFCLTFNSCKKDDPEPEVKNQVEYNGTKSTLVSGAYIDFGTYNYYGTTPTHLNYDFFATDGNLVVSNGELTDIKGKMTVYVYLESFGTTSFNTGTYTYLSGEGDGALTNTQLTTKYQNKSFMAAGAVYISSDINASIDATSTQEIDVKSGSVTVSGTKPNYTLTYDLVLENNNTVKGSYSGNFQGFVD
jgi:hypothetical protein